MTTSRSLRDRQVLDLIAEIVLCTEALPTADVDSKITTQDVECL